MRWVLALGVVAGATVLGGCFGDEDPGTPSTPAAETPAAQSSSASAANRAFSPAQPVLQRTLHSPGETLPGDNSVGFMDPATGDLELWTALPGRTIAWLQPSRDGALIVAQVAIDEWFVTERASGQNWRLRNELRPHIGIGYGPVLGAFTNINNGRLVLLDFAAGTEREVPYTRPNLMTYSVASSEDGKMIVIGDGSSFVLVDLPSATVTPVGATYAGLRARPLEYNAGFVLAPSLPAVGDSFVFDWTGTPRAESAEDLAGLSPDGKLRARRSNLGRIALAEGLGELPLLDYFVIERAADGAPTGRMLGAAFAGWSADSRRLLIHERGNEPAVISVDGERLAAVPWWPEVAKGFAWFSPRASELVATNHGVVNLESGARFEYVPLEGAYVVTNWAPGGDTLILRGGPIPGKGGGSGRQLFEARYESAPFADPGLTVAAGADCLNLREGPSVTTSPLRCLSTGAIVALREIDLESLPAGASNPVVGVRETPESTWLHVETSDGEAGWVDAAYLDWAP